MSAEPQLSIVIAVQSAHDNLSAILNVLDIDRNRDVQFIFCAAGRECSALCAIDTGDNVVKLERSGALIPHLWRDGIRVATGTWVATTTAHCIPAADWVARLRAHTADDAAAIGGVLTNDASARTMDWAIFLLRYLAFAVPQRPQTVNDVAADNAMYRRELVLQNADLLAEGFWEPAFHARFRAKGYALRLDPALQVIHRNRYRAGEFFRQRMAHGREFGYARAASLSLPKRIGFVLAAPLLPAVFLRKILRAAKDNSAASSHVSSALGWLLFFIVGWSIGEAMGYLAALWRPRAK